MRKTESSSKASATRFLSHQANLDEDGRRSLKTLLKANKRLHKAYLLKESFGQLWDYNNAAWARKFFDNWKAQLKWQRLKPFEDFAALIERHWDGIISYCHPDNKVSLGFMEGLNNKIRLIQRRAFGIKRSALFETESPDLVCSGPLNLDKLPTESGEDPIFLYGAKNLTHDSFVLGY